MSPVDPTGIDRRRRNIRTSNTNCSACAFTAPYANDRIALRVFVRKRGAGYRIQCDIPLGEDALPLRGCASSPPQTWDFAVICARIGAHAMLHNDIACAPAPGARLRAFRPEYQGKCRTRQFPLDNSRILRLQSVYTVIATPPETSRISRKAAGQCNGVTRCTHQRKHTYSPLSTRRNHPVPTPQASQGRVSFAGFTALPFLNNSALAVRFQHLAHLSSANVL